MITVEYVICIEIKVYIQRKSKALHYNMVYEEMLLTAYFNDVTQYKHNGICMNC